MNKVLLNLSNIKYYLLVGFVCAGLAYFLKPVKIEKVIEIEYVEVEKKETSERSVSSETQKLKAGKLNISPTGEISAENVEFETSLLIQNERHTAEIRELREKLRLKEEAEVVNSLDFFGKADFSRENKHLGYAAGVAYGSLVTDLKLDPEFKYNGYMVGVRASFRNFSDLIPWSTK